MEMIAWPRLHDHHMISFHCLLTGLHATWMPASVFLFADMCQYVPARTSAPVCRCGLRGFHAHPETSTGQELYELCGHVYLNPRAKHSVIDLR